MCDAPKRSRRGWAARARAGRDIYRAIAAPSSRIKRRGRAATSRTRAAKIVATVYGRPPDFARYRSLAQRPSSVQLANQAQGTRGDLENPGGEDRGHRLRPTAGLRSVPKPRT